MFSIAKQDGTLTIEILGNSKRQTSAQLKSHSLRGLFDKRLVSIECFGTSFTSRVTCLGDQVDQKYDAAVKDRAEAQRL